MKRRDILTRDTIEINDERPVVDRLPIGVRIAAGLLRSGRRRLPAQVVDRATYHVNQAIASRVRHLCVGARLVSGVWVNIPLSDYEMRRIALLGEYETDVQAFAAHIIAPGDLVVDIGANFGLHTLPFARLTGRRGQVVAIEPAPRACALLAMGVEQNGYGNRVFVTQAAAGAASETASLWLDDGVGLMNSLRTDWTASTQAIQVAVVALDSVLSSYGGRPLALLKIDAEGCGADILRGAQQTLTHRRPRAIILEVSSQEKPSTLLETMQGHGYRRVQLQKRQIASAGDPLPRESRGRVGDSSFSYTNLYFVREEHHVEPSKRITIEEIR